MKGLTILLHGAPGTGKTQLVLNLSKLTKRPIMKIDITMVLDKWVGNSEKNLLNIFQNHKTACERMEVAPILFLNECDQILGKRIGIRNSVDSMNNALQNILLEQMEQFDGIMIGSTNNTNNIDEAFERRFTMKFEFESPNELAMISIWKSSIKGLRQNEARELVKQFKFSGGEISNVARRFMLENLLGLKKTRLQTLIELCNTERYQNNNTRSIGFSVEKSLSLKRKAI
jgi:SpoVK/Ycf46/Vps4 family AAA+-type ATPase